MNNQAASSLNKTVVISGASSGIGAASAFLFSKMGYDVLLLGRNFDRLKQVKEKCNPKVKCNLIAIDLCEIDKHTELIETELSKLSPLSCLINNAGVFQAQPVDHKGLDDWYSQFEINLFAAVKLTKILWKHLIANNNSSIVNVSSTLGLKPTADTSAYSASKAALINYTISLAQSGAKYGTRVNCICPGIVDTPIHSFYHLPKNEADVVKSNLAPLQPLNRIGTPEEIAQSIYFLASENSSWTTGSILSVDGGINISNG